MLRTPTQLRAIRMCCKLCRCVVSIAKNFKIHFMTYMYMRCSMAPEISAQTKCNLICPRKAGKKQEEFYVQNKWPECMQIGDELYSQRYHIHVCVCVSCVRAISRPLSLLIASFQSISPLVQNIFMLYGCKTYFLWRKLRASKSFSYLLAGFK